MQHSFRSRVWRELPYSARRTIVGVLRTIDDFEAFCRAVWRSLTYSPAWIFVAICGAVGIVLTILLFFLLTQELLAGTSARSQLQPLVEEVASVVSDRNDLDSRLCLDDIPIKPQPYPAEFGYGDAIQFADRQPTRRPPARQVVLDVPDFTQPIDNDPFPDWPTQPAGMTVEAGAPALQVAVNHALPRNAPSIPLRPAQVLTARSLAEFVSNLRIDEFSPNLHDAWSSYRALPKSTKDEPYSGDRSVTLSASEELNDDDFTAWPNRADLGLRLELQAPLQSVVGSYGRSEITIANIGDDTIRRIEVQEPIQSLGLVTHAEPPAMLNGGTLYRELRRLGAQRSKSLSLDWVTPTAGSYQHTAQVLAEAYVAAMVDVRGTQPERIAIEPATRLEPTVIPLDDPAPEPEPVPESRPEPRRPPRRSAPVESPVVPEDPPSFTPPPAAAALEPEPQKSIVCRVHHESQVDLNAMTELQIVVENTGNVPLNAVKIQAEIPGKLRHKHGEHVEYAVGDLAAGQVHHAVLRVVGQTAGTSTTRIIAVSQEVSSNDASATLDITVPNRPMQAAPSRPAARPSIPRGCECPQQQVSWAGFEF